MDCKDINIIAAVALDGSIGRSNALLWQLKEDMKFFRSTTMGHPVIMGRKTFESIGRALPGRRNFVISRSHPALPEGVQLCGSLEEALDMAGDGAFVIGGAAIYAEAMKYASTMYITRVFATYPDADAFLPAIMADEWDIIEQGEVHQENGLEFRFEKYGKTGRNN